MKKICFIVLLLCVALCQSCFYSSVSNDIKFYDFEVFDKNGNKLEGNLSDIRNLDLVNSAAPRCFYYCVDGIKGESYTINMYFTFIGKEELEFVTFKNRDFYGYIYKDNEEFEFKNIDIIPEKFENRKYKLTYNIDSLDYSNMCLTISSWTTAVKNHKFGISGNQLYDLGVFVNYKEIALDA